MGKTKSVLGKGLSALIPGASGLGESMDQEVGRPSRSITLATKREPDAVAEIPLENIQPNPQQPRKDFGEETLRELTNSIREHGVIQAVTVRRTAEDRYELVSGERRVRAAKEAGLTSIPAFVIDVGTDRKMLEYAIIENVQRSQLNPIEEAEAYERLIKDCDLTQEEVAEKIAKDRTTISNFLRLLKLPETIKHSLRLGELGLGHAKAVMSVTEPGTQESLWKRAIAESLSVRRLEELARSYVRDHAASNGAQKRSGRPMKKEDAPGEVLVEGGDDMAQKLKQVFGTQAKIKMKPDRTGEVTLHFYSDDDLERILDLLLSVQAE